MAILHKWTGESGAILPGDTLTGADISVATAAKLGGGAENQWGLQVVINDTDDDYLSTAVWADQTEVWIRWDMELVTGFTMADADEFADISIYGQGATTAYVLMSYFDAWGEIRLQLNLKDDGAGTQGAGFASGDAITVGSKHRFDLHLRASSAPEADDGLGELYLDGNKIIEVTGVDNDTLVFDQILKLGNMAADAGTSGTIYFDNIEVNTAGPIGAYVGPTIPPAGLYTMQEYEAGAVAVTIVSTADYGSGAGWRMCIEHTSVAIKQLYIGESPKTYTSNLCPTTALSTPDWNLLYAQTIRNEADENWLYLCDGTAGTLTKDIDTPAIVQLTLANVYKDVAGFDGTIVLTLHPSGKAVWKSTDTIGVGKAGDRAQSLVLANSTQFGAGAQDVAGLYSGLTDSNGSGQDLRACVYGSSRYVIDGASSATNGNGRYSTLQKVDLTPITAGIYSDQTLLSFMADTDGSAERNDYRNPDPLTGGANEGSIAIGSLVTDDTGDDDTDGFNESTGYYVLQALGNRLRFTLDPLRGGGSPYDFLKPGIKVNDWDRSIPTQINVAGQVKKLNEDYVASLDGSDLYLQLLSDVAAKTEFIIGSFGSSRWWWWE